MFIENFMQNIKDSLMLMMTGMVGIFAVMVALLIAIVILNRVTVKKNKKDDNE